MCRASVAAAPLVVAALLHYRPASAGDAVEVEVAAVGGFTAATGIGPETRFGPGFGGRVGVSIEGIYAGAIAEYHAGNMNAALVQGGFEGGYGFRLLDDRITLRPVFGAGSAVIAGEGPALPAGGGQTQSEKWIATGQGFLYLEPRLECLFALDRFVFAGVEGEVIVIPNGLWNYGPNGGATTLVGGGAHLEIGARF